MKKTDQLITAHEVNHVLSGFLKKGQTPFGGNRLPCKAEIMTRYHVDPDLLATYADMQPVRFGDIAGKTATRIIRVGLLQANRPCVAWLNLDVWFTGYGKVNVRFSGIALTEAEAGETRRLELPDYARAYQIDYLNAVSSVNNGLSRPAIAEHLPNQGFFREGQSEILDSSGFDGIILFGMHSL